MSLALRRKSSGWIEFAGGSSSTPVSSLQKLPRKFLDVVLTLRILTHVK